MVIGIIVVVLLVLVIIFFISMYNSLIGLRNQVKNAWSQIDVQLKRRHDLIPNLIETVKGYMNHERTTLEDVGKELGVTRERVRQIQMDALRRLRDILEKDGFSVDTIFK